jgi:hypothetical protein
LAKPLTAEYAEAADSKKIKILCGLGVLGG